MTEIITDLNPGDINHQIDDIIIENSDENDLKDEEGEVEVAVEKSHAIRLSKLPLARVKNIMKVDPDVKLASQDSIILVAKATEMFLTAFAKDIGKHMLKTKRKTILKRDIDAAIGSVSQLCFLEGTLD